MTFKQQQKIKSSIIDANNHLNRILSSFDSLNSEFHPSYRLIDIFSSHISFHNADHSSNKSKAAHCKKLNKIILESSSDQKSVIIITDASIKNNVTASIAHIHFFNNPLKKMLHHVVDITPTEAELFTIRCGINQAVQTQDVSCIIVITNTIHVSKKIIDPFMHPHQQQTIAVSKELHAFFNNHSDNTIEFWNCPKDEWHLHAVVYKEMKKFDLVPLYPSKLLWDFNKKEECDNIIKEWCMTFKSLDLKRRNFLHLLNNNLSEIKLSYTKGGPWPEHIGFSNLLCARATQAITNHVPREEFKCLCRLYPIKSKHHILHECR